MVSHQLNTDEPEDEDCASEAEFDESPNGSRGVEAQSSLDAELEGLTQEQKEDLLHWKNLVSISNQREMREAQSSLDAELEGLTQEQKEDLLHWKNSVSISNQREMREDLHKREKGAEPLFIEKNLEDLQIDSIRASAPKISEGPDTPNVGIVVNAEMVPNSGLINVAVLYVIINHVLGVRTGE
ncbi:MAG: hypothetical protein Q9187_008113 [Circinaria calcarea]